MRDNLIINLGPKGFGDWGTVQREHNGGWVVARPEGYGSIIYRIRAAWLVFTGRADALVWPAGQ